MNDGSDTLDGVADRRSRRLGAIGWLSAVAGVVVLVGLLAGGLTYYLRYVRQPDVLRGTSQRPAPPLVASDDPARGSIALFQDGDRVPGPEVRLAVVAPEGATQMQVGFDPSFASTPWLDVADTATVRTDHVGYQVVFGRFRSGPDATPTETSTDGVFIDPTYDAATSSTRGIQQASWVRTAGSRQLVVRIEAGRLRRGAQIRYDFENPPSGDSVKGWIGPTTVDRDGGPYGVKVDGSDDLLRVYDVLVGDPIDTDRLDEGLWVLEDGRGDQVRLVAVERITRPAGAGAGPGDERIVPVVHDVILTTAEPLDEGAAYTVRPPTDVVQPVAFTFDSTATRSPAVHTNQNGYGTNDAAKVAYVSRPYFEVVGDEPYRNGMAFQVISEDHGGTVFEGELTRRPRGDELALGDLTGTPVFEADFSELTAIGRFRLCVESVGCSETFRIGNQVWNDLALAVARSMYHQRSGVALGPPYTSVARPRPYHPDDGMVIRESGFRLLDAADAPLDDVFAGLVDLRTDLVLEDAWGGHFDAGDWDRRIQHLYYVRAAIEVVDRFPSRFAEVELGIPESGDEVPDVLDEALWSLDLYRRLQRPDGAVRGGIEASEHPRSDNTSWTDNLAVFAYAPDPYSSYVYAGVAAQMADVLERYDPERAAIYADSAVLAAQWAEDQPEEAAYAEMVAAERAVAAAALYKLTGQETWHDVFRETSGFADGVDAFLACNNHTKCDGGWIYLSIPPERTDPALRSLIEQSFVASAEEIVAAADTTAFGWSVENRFVPLVWGLGPGGSPSAIGLVRAYAIEPDERYLAAAQRSAAVSLGANPLNTVYMTGVGRNPVRHPVLVDALHGGLPVWPGTPVYGPHRLNSLSDDTWVDDFVLEPAGVQPLGRDLPYLWQWFDVSHVAVFNEYTVFQSHAEAFYAYGFLAGLG
ncbi:MAG: glycoside hydrolase family 9 protein [Actinomycetota bacterium]